MPRAKLSSVLVILLLALIASPLHARDWFIKAGATSGDGTKDKPFSDPFEALEKAEAGDAIHIAAGKYLGKLNAGEWEIPFDNVQIIGGYNADFSQRDPWKNHTLLLWDRSAKNYPKEERLRSNKKGIVIDGLILDGQDQNEYSDEKKSGRSQKSLDTGSAMIRLWLPGTIKNCVILNTGKEAIVCPNGTTIENNLFLNVFESAVKINGLPGADPASKVPSSVKNNTFLWSWCEKAPAKGRYSGAAISMSGPANITNNIFGHCDNNAIFSSAPTERTSITNNVFFMNLFSNFKLFLDSKDVVVDDKSMDMLEETGLKAFEGNTVKNPNLPLDSDWLDGAAKRTAAQRGKVEMDDWNKYRQLAGLPIQATGGKPASGVAPAYPLDKALALMTPKDAAVKAGARVVPLEAKFSGIADAGPAKAYERVDTLAWGKDPSTHAGKSIELVVAMSGVGNVSSIPAPHKPAEHEAIKLHDSMGNVNILGYYKKGTAANRTVNEGMGRYQGSGKADRLYVVKGTAYAEKSFPKAGIYIDSIEPFAAVAAARERAKGRDWFVRAGSSGGDGSKEKPFRDPYQALEKVEAGDFIHVAGGEYVGKLKTGQWKVDCPDISLLGGYSSDFSARDPWKNPTVLQCPADFKGRRGGYTLEGADDHTGFVLDGFVFDKKLNNTYDNSGDMTDNSDHSPHLWLSKPGCVIRNCVFVNGCEGAARLSSAQTIENNIFLNHGKWVVRMERAFTPEVPAVFKDNTVAFAWEKKFGEGNGRTGELLTIEGDVRIVVDNNVFEFADHQAIRLNASPKDVELTNNVFAHNLWADIYQARDGQIIDEKTFGQLNQLGWKKCEGNARATPGLPLEQKWFDVYLSRTAMTPGKVQMDDWNKAREILGQPLIATGGAPGKGYAPAYDRSLAMQLFPKNDKIKAGARPKQLEVKFEGVAKPAAEQHEYAETTWEVASKADDWAKLAGKRVSLKVAIKSVDNQWLLAEAPKEKFAVYQVGGPEGSNSPGLPMRVYVPLGTRLDRAFKNAKGYSSGPVAETHIIKGVAHDKRQMIVEAVERAD
jgi:hypothetical protein